MKNKERFVFKNVSMKKAAYAYFVFQITVLFLAIIFKISSLYSYTSVESVSFVSTVILIGSLLSVTTYIYVMRVGKIESMRFMERSKVMRYHKFKAEEFFVKFKDITNAMRDMAFWEIDMSGKIIYLSNGVRHMFNIPPEKYLGENIISIVSRDSREEFLQYYHEILVDPVLASPFIAKLSSGSGKNIYIEIHSVGKSIVDGKNIGVYGFLIDATGKVSEIEKEHRKNEIYASIIDKTGEYIWAVDKNGDMIFANESAKREFGDKINIGNSFYDILVNGSRNDMVGFFKKYKKKYGRLGSFKGDVCEHPKSKLLIFKNKDGNRVILHSFLTKKFKNGKFDGLKGTSIDVTPQFRDIFDTMKKSNDISNSISKDVAEMNTNGDFLGEFNVN